MEESKSTPEMDYQARVKRYNSETLYSRKCHNRNKLECMNLSIENQVERKLVDEVLRIKSILDKSKRDVEYGSWAVYDRYSVSVLKKHDFKHVSHVARMLVEDWRRVADEWVAAIKETNVVT
ncbi:hypothetical protein Tco_0655597 [Tanacetum coccineum]|uniref:TFIIS N-terminal domain-containing protein n=1 Tax=Tanacetum coccineum TaxID=301880 RepID=A0ABQ4X6W7_9ASTR